MNEQTAQVLRSSQTNQQSVNEMVLLLHKVASMFQPAINRIDELQNRNISTADNLDGIQVEVSKLVEAAKFYTQHVSLEMQGLCNQLGESVATQQMFKDSVKSTEAATKSLDNSANKITDLNKQTAQVLALTQTNQQSFSQIVALLYKTAEKFQPVIDKIDELQNRNVSTTSNLGNIKTEISYLIITVKDHTKQMTLEMQDLCNHLVKNITAQQATSNNYQDKTAIHETQKIRENSRDRVQPEYNSFEQ